MNARRAQSPPPADERDARPGHGFTLIEMIIALTVLAIAIPASLWSIRDATTKRANPVLSNLGHWYAAERLEDIIADRNSPNRGYAYVIAGNYPVENEFITSPVMNRSVSIVETSPTFAAGTGLKTVTVTVSYADGQNTTQNVSIATVITDYTP